MGPTKKKVAVKKTMPVTSTPKATGKGLPKTATAANTRSLSKIPKKTVEVESLSPVVGPSIEPVAGTSRIPPAGSPRAPTEFTDELQDVRQEGEGMSRMAKHIEQAELTFRENQLLRQAAKEEAAVVERIRRERNELRDKILAMATQMEMNQESMDQTREEGEIYGEGDEEQVDWEGEEEEAERGVDHEGRRSWMSQVLSKQKEDEESKVWVKLGKSASANAYLKQHWQHWKARDLETDKSRIEALLQQYTDLWGSPKILAEILKGMSEVKLSLIAAMNKCNENGRLKPHAAFSSLMLDADNIGKYIVK